MDVNHLRRDTLHNWLLIFIRNVIHKLRILHIRCQKVSIYGKPYT
jgi:hypothetical protein